MGSDRVSGYLFLLNRLFVTNENKSLTYSSASVQVFNIDKTLLEVV
jgi:hypothetical protein